MIAWNAAPRGPAIGLMRDHMARIRLGTLGDLKLKIKCINASKYSAGQALVRGPEMQASRMSGK